MNCNEDHTIYEFEEKPKHPKSTLASMGIYIFNWKKLRAALIADEADPNSSNDFGKNIIPMMLGNGDKLMAGSSTVTGKTSEPSPRCGTLTWTCSTPKADCSWIRLTEDLFEKRGSSAALY